MVVSSLALYKPYNISTQTHIVNYITGTNAKSRSLPSDTYYKTTQTPTHQYAIFTIHFFSKLFILPTTIQLTALHMHAWICI